MLCAGLISILFSVPLFSYCISPTIFNRRTCIVLIYSTFLSINIFNINNLGIFNRLFHIGPIQIYGEAFIYICGAIILIGFSYSSSTRNRFPNVNEVGLIILFAILGQTLLIRSIDIFSFYITLELQSFAVYVLCTLYRQRERATIAGLKYFILGGLSRAIILLGISLIYYETGTTQFEDIFRLFASSIGENDYQLPIIIGISLILIGLLFKIGRAPLHFWAPDVYDGIPTAITIFVQTIPKIRILIIIVEILRFTWPGRPNTFNDILLYASLSSLVIGTVVGLSQFRIKRLLAYSSIRHVGFITLCLVINNQERISTFLFYLVQYSLTNICVFLCIIAYGNFKDISLISELKIKFQNQPLITLSFILCLFRIAGIPPLIGFYAKMIVMQSCIEQGYYAISLVCVIVSVISASYYLKIVKVLYFDTDTNSDVVRQDTIMISNLHRFAIAILTIIITFYIIIPEILLNTSKLIAIRLFHY